MTSGYQQDRLIALVTVVSASLFYGSLTSHYPVVEDDGLFIMASWAKGTTHAPGYPLFVLLAQPFLWLSFGTVAFKVHLLNCVLAGLTLGCLYLLLRQLNLARAAAVVAVACLGLSALFFQQALIAEAYMLNVVLMLALIATLLRLRDRESDQWLTLSALLYGLALSNHWPLTLLVTPVFFILALPLLKRYLARLPFVLPAFLTGLLPYAWMYFTQTDDQFNHAGAFRSFGDLVSFVSREVYSGADQSTYATGNEKALFLTDYVHSFATQYSPAVFVLLLAGLFLSFRRLALPVALALALFLCLPVVLLVMLDFHYNRTTLASMLAYPLPLYVVSAIWIAVATTYLFERLPPAKWPSMVIALSLVASVGYQNRDVASYGDAAWSMQVSRELLLSVPPESTLFTMHNWSMGQISYLHFVDGVRQDVSLVSRHATFQPTRLFSFYAAPGQKHEALKAFISESDKPSYALSAFDLVPREPPLPDEVLAMFLMGEPAGVWEDIYWRELLLRYVRVLTVEQALASSRIAVPVAVAKHLMKKESFDSTQVAQLLDHAGTLAGRADRFDLAEFAWVQALYFASVGEQQLASDLAMTAMDFLPLAYNPALGLLLDQQIKACDERGLMQLIVQYAVKQEDFYRSRLSAGCRS